MPDRERFLAKVEISDSDDCWLWNGSTNGQGYGSFWDGTRLVGAHRWAYQEYVGSIPDGAFVMHICDVSMCVNPEHLTTGSHIDNMADMRAKGREAHRFRDQCPNGHAYADDNYRVMVHSKDGHEYRKCLICERDARRRHRATHLEQEASAGP